ncbi:MAG: hypothetical protein J7L46_03890 [Bacteroidales bacterium]|nr:hypothetical protein [Bacteroidales bacterium]
MKKKKKRKNLQRRIVKRKKGDIASEANYIISCAKEYDARIVSFGPLLFFSTENGDAWMLDPEDSFAFCLAKECEPQAVNFDEIDENYKIEWTADYQIDDGVFHVFDRLTNKVTSYFQYPIHEILSFSIRQEK